MASMIARYAHWLHTRWPAGEVEKLPQVEPDGSTNLPGLYVVGDLTGIPLLKFSADSGARAVRTIVADPGFQTLRADAAGEAVDLVIIGAGVSGMAAAVEARKAGLRYELLEAATPFSTIVNFPKGKPIYTYPTDMVPEGEIQFTAQVKEPLLDEMQAQTTARGIQARTARAERVSRQGSLLEVHLAGEPSIRARRVIVAIGRSGNFRQLGVPGEALGKVYNRLHDPKDFAGKHVLVVGGGDSALETAIAIAACGGLVTLSYRKKELSRPKPENVERLEALVRDPSAEVEVETPVSERVTTAMGDFMGSYRKPGHVQRLLGSQVKRIGETEVEVTTADGRDLSLPNDAVFSMIGREAPLEFFRRSGVKIRGELTAAAWTTLALFMAFCIFVYNWKAGGEFKKAFEARGWFPFNMPGALKGLGGSIGAMAADASSLLGTLTIALSEPGFYYSVAYCAAVVAFGVRRMRRKPTPYIRAQTLALMAIQVVPLFFIPYLVLPWLGNNGAFDAGFGLAFADALFPKVDYGFGREYWRAFGLILAWPLFIWNVFTWQPLTAWLVISLVQTFVIIPIIVWRWGKGAYCGWICSCGALAETLGDAHRHKMPHGPFWNRLNMLGQAILLAALLLFAGRALSWTWPDSTLGRYAGDFYNGLLSGWKLFGIQTNYYWVVDVTLAGIVGVGLYFWFSGRVWCRFACPLAALMHIYARFSQFRILADKKKCISCNVCTSVCHQGIDVMNFANKGLPMADPECVRCSACVQSCPTGVLEFGAVDPKSGAVLRRDSLPASPVRMREREGKGGEAAPKAAGGFGV